jgi:hypothetical protein
VLAADTARFLSDRAALIVGVVGADGRPFAARGWGLEVLDPGSGRARLLLDAADLDRLAHLAGGGALAVTGSDVPSLRSCQLKGRVDGFEVATDDDLAHSAAYCAGFFGDVERTDHLPPWKLERLRPDELVACLLTVEEVYDQTPGPAAGRPLRAPS